MQLVEVLKPQTLKDERKLTERSTNLVQKEADFEI